MGLWEFISDRAPVLAGDSWQHFSLVVQSLFLATIIGVALALLVYRTEAGSAIANALSAIGLTIPSFALLGALSGVISLGVLPAVVGLVFYGSLPILRNAVVGLRAVDPALIESARGMGMNRFTAMIRLELPLAWPVILTGIRVSGQMLMGIAAIAAYVLGPGLGVYIFSGVSRAGGAGALTGIIVSTVLIILLAIVLDLLLGIVGRFTVSRGIRV